jgi:hypothetical protein
MSKADEKRAAIVAQQAAREAAEREARRLAGTDKPAPKTRTNWAASSRGPGPRRGRPPKAPLE